MRQASKKRPARLVEETGRRAIRNHTRTHEQKARTDARGGGGEGEDDTENSEASKPRGEDDGDDEMTRRRATR